MKTSKLILAVLGALAGSGVLLAYDNTAISPLQSPTVAQQVAQQAAQARAYEAALAEQNFKNSFIPRDPWRAINGETNFVKLDGVEFCGKVVDVTPHGVRISGDFDELFNASYFPNTSSDYTDFFVTNFPFEVVNDQVIPENEHLMAWYVGTYTYSTVNGGSRTIKKLDYGIPCGIPTALVKAAQEAAQARAIADKKKVEQGQIAAVHWLQSQATNGSPSAQYSLGIHYLNGQGCEPNREQAIYWFQQSAAQGNVEASNKLATLKQ